MNETALKLKTAINRQTADTAALRLLLIAMARQIPDKVRLIRDFSEMAEDHEIHTIYSTMPDSFFEQLRTTRATWLQVLQDNLLSPAPGH